MKTDNKNSFSIFLLPFSFSFFLLLFSFCFQHGCTDNPTANKETVTISGTVSLEGETDYSGVKISLYKPMELDTALVRINQQYPNIGVQISQETDFDHREHTAISSTTSKVDGSWKLENGMSGKYNIVLEKVGFGWRYLLDLDEPFSVKDVTLLMEENVNSINGDFKFESFRIYNIRNDLKVDNYKIEIQESAIIKISSDKTLTFNTPVNFTSGGYCIFLCDDGGEFDKIIFSSINQIANNIIVRNAKNGIKLENNNSVLANYHSSNIIHSGLTVSNCENIHISNVIIKNSESGIYVFNSSDVEIINSIFLANEIGVNSYSSSTKLENSLIYLNSEIGVLNEIEDSLAISNTEVVNNKVGLQVQGNAYCNINSSVINKNITGINCLYLSASGIPPNTIVANYNSLINDSYNMIISRIGGINSIDLRNNFWDLYSEFQIRETIRFADNEIATDPQIIPFLSEYPPDIGIQ